jgi:hypothetical protein
VRRTLIAATSLGALALGPASAVGASVDAVVSALRTDSVYVAPGSRPTLTAAEAASLRVRIALRDAGRIRLAVVPAALATRSGSVGALTNAIDRRLQRQGTLVVVAGSGIHLVVSYDDVAGALRAVRGAVAAHRHERLERRLAAAVDRLARVDPSAPGIGFDPGRLHLPDPARTVKNVVDTFRIVAIVVALAFALPILAITLAVVRRIRRRSRAPMGSRGVPVTPSSPTFTGAPRAAPPQPVARPPASEGDDAHSEANRALGRPDG